MGVSLIICCYVLNYFEKIYVRFILGWTLASILLDLVWLIIKTHVKVLLFRVSGMLMEVISIQRNKSVY